jgi:trans-aconitate methyltransferase
VDNNDRKSHWEKIHQSKALQELSWYQSIPEPSLRMFRELGVQPTAKVIDIGGGDSLLVDHLLEQGFSDLSVLDISEAALEKTKSRLGRQAAKVKWIVADVTAFEPEEHFDVWHDRAVFHFLLKEEEISRYVQSAHKSLSPYGLLIVGTFSDQGPEKCSGLPVRRYSESALADCFSQYFEKLNAVYCDHITPSGAVQNFVFCGFKKLEEAW